MDCATTGLKNFFTIARRRTQRGRGSTTILLMVVAVTRKRAGFDGKRKEGEGERGNDGAEESMS